LAAVISEEFLEEVFTMGVKRQFTANCHQTKNEENRSHIQINNSVQME